VEGLNRLQVSTMAGSERSKNLPLAAGSCYEGKDCGGIEHTRGRGFRGRTRVTERKKNCHDHRCPLGSVRLRSDGRACGSVGAVMQEGKQSGLMASVHEGNSSEKHGIGSGRTKSVRRDYCLDGECLPVIMFASLPCSTAPHNGWAARCRTLRLRAND
jgi:hypothetical protein